MKAVARASPLTRGEARAHSTLPTFSHYSGVMRSLLRGFCACAWLLISCAQSAPPHGTISSMSVASSHDWKACEHDVPEEVCTRCRPERLQAFKDRGDYCIEHGIPESQCLKCHPDLDFSPPKPAPEGADVQEIAKGGADVPALEPYLAKDKVTVFDFWAAWCPPCRKVDEHLHGKLAEHAFAIRKIDVSAWDSPVAKRWLAQVPSLPYLVIYGRDGKRVAEISGPDFEAIDAAISAGAK
jgi:thiol-disulfide isomerase/thioredoxin